MFLNHQSWCCSGSLRLDSKPGAPFCQSGITEGEPACWAWAHRQGNISTASSAGVWRGMVAQSIYQGGEKKPRNAGLVSVVVVDLGNRCQPSKSTTRTEIISGWDVGGLAASG